MNKQELLNLCKVEIKKVDVELEGVPKTLYIKTLTLDKLLHLEAATRGDSTGTRTFIYSIILSLCDADGNPIFTEDDYDSIAAMDGNKIAALAGVITDATSLKLDIEQAEKN